MQIILSLSLSLSRHTEPTRLILRHSDRFSSFVILFDSQLTNPSQLSVMRCEGAHLSFEVYRTTWDSGERVVDRLLGHGLQVEVEAHRRVHHNSDELFFFGFLNERFLTAHAARWRHGNARCVTLTYSFSEISV